MLKSLETRGLSPLTILAPLASAIALLVVAVNLQVSVEIYEDLLDFGLTIT